MLSKKILALMCLATIGSSAFGSSAFSSHRKLPGFSYGETLYTDNLHALQIAEFQVPIQDPASRHLLGAKWEAQDFNMPYINEEGSYEIPVDSNEYDNKFTYFNPNQNRYYFSVGFLNPADQRFYLVVFAYNYIEGDQIIAKATIIQVQGREHRFFAEAFKSFVDRIKAADKKRVSGIVE